MSTASTDIEMLRKKCRQIRATCVQLSHDARVGHLGSSLSCVEALVASYYRFLHIAPDSVNDVNRDRFILSKGHACSALYAVLADCGFFPIEWLHLYAQKGTPLPHHPCKYALPVLECSTGSLGHGLGIATGMLYGLKLKGVSSRAVVLLSDGECNEGSVWEAAMFAAAQKQENLFALVDYNQIQAVGRSDEIMGFTSLEEKFRSFGWAARSVPGNDLQQVVEAMSLFPFGKNQPSVLILKTRKGAGVSFMEDQVLWHYRVPSDEDLMHALAELRAEPLHLAPKLQS